MHTRTHAHTHTRTHTHINFPKYIEKLFTEYLQHTGKYMKLHEKLYTPCQRIFSSTDTHITQQHIHTQIQTHPHTQTHTHTHTHKSISST